MEYYYIYHIPHFKRKNGKIGKIGCSDEVQARIEEQGYVFSECKILEIHTDIYVASDRELELQKQYGYPVDKYPYWIMIERRRKGGKIGGNIHSNLRNEKCSKLGKVTGKKNVWLMLKNRKKYTGVNNPNCNIDEKIAQSILNYYTDLVLKSKSKYGLIPKTVNHFSNVPKFTVIKICKRQTWKHLTPNPN
jgi:hypothetical protein